MTDSRMPRFEIWGEWQPRPDMTAADGADRAAASLRRLHEFWPDGTEAFTTGSTAKSALPVADEHLAQRLVPGFKASRNKNLFKDTELFGDANLQARPAGDAPVSIRFNQVAAANSWAAGRFELRVGPPASDLLVERPDGITGLIADLAAIWQGRNAWIDMPHVRQDWNCWNAELPVYGWATWLHPSFATVDTDGLDVDTHDAAGGGTLVVLRVDPAAMASREAAVGKDVIRELARRTTLADGTPLLDANQRLRDALADSNR